MSNTAADRARAALLSGQPPDPADTDACALYFCARARIVHHNTPAGAPYDEDAAAVRYVRAIVDIDRAYAGEIAALAAGHPARLAVDAQTEPRYRAAYLTWRAEQEQEKAA